MPFAFRIHGLHTKLEVARFEGAEAISELFEIELTLVGRAEEPVEIDAVLGQEACLLFDESGASRCVHGLVARFEQLEVDARTIVYGARLVPRVHRLLLRHDCRIFQADEGQSLTTPQILRRVLEGAGVLEGTHYRLALRGEHTPRDYCVQYRESDWAFCSRLMEEDGIFYYFEHTEEGHVLVLGDAPAAHEDLPGGPLRFRELGVALIGGEHISRFHYAGEVRSDKITLRDHDFQKPNAPLESSAAVPSGGALAIYDYPGAYVLPASGDRRARFWLEEQQVPRRQGNGESRSERLVPGYIFELYEHPHDAMNRRYLVTRVEHTGVEPALAGDPGGGSEARYENRFQCIPAEVPFRSPRVTPKPVIQGIQTAVVVCPSGEEIETDRHGRVKVRFHWDREDRSSCWVRVGQVWAGGGFGAIFLPRRGHEVLVSFLEGDPDRPVIVGSLYHATHVTPYPLPAENTRSGIKSNSSPDGGGANELWFEDRKGSEAIHLHARKDFSARVENDQTTDVGNDRRQSVGGDAKETVAGSVALEVGKSLGERIEIDRTVDVGGDLAEYVAGNRATRVDGDSTARVRGTMTTTVAGEKLELACGGVRITITPGGVAIEGGALTVDGKAVVLR